MVDVVCVSGHPYEYVVSIWRPWVEKWNHAPFPAETCSRADQVGEDQLSIRDRVGRKRRAVPLRDLCAESLGSLTDGEGRSQRPFWSGRTVSNDAKMPDVLHQFRRA